MNKKIIAVGLQFEEIKPEEKERPAFRIPLYSSIESSARKSGPLWFDGIHSISHIRRQLDVLLRGIGDSFYQIKYECPDYIQHLTGREIKIPMIEFNDFLSYATFCRSRGMARPPQGFTMYVNDPVTMLPIPLIVYYDKQLPNAMPPMQIKKYEAMHAVDPNVNKRDKREVYLTELAAVIGEHVYHPGDAESFYNRGPIRTFEGFWMGYYMKDGIVNVPPGLLKVLKLMAFRADPSEVARKIVQFVDDLTSGRIIGNVSHAEIVLLLMSCKSFDELYEKIKQLNPSYYPQIEEVRESRLRLDPGLAELVGRMRSLMEHYYRNWPEVYRFNKKLISSLWQARDYAGQAMRLFLFAKDIRQQDIEIARVIVNLALSIFGIEIETYDITNYEIRIIPEGENTRIIIIWQ